MISAEAPAMDVITRAIDACAVAGLSNTSIAITATVGVEASDRRMP
jgi:hypothetical protein